VEKSRILFITTTIFFICVALLFGYLLGMRFYSPPPMALFWVTAVTAVLIVVYQITQIQWHGYEGLLLAEIIMLGIALHTVYQIPFYGIYDSDSYETMVQVRRVLEFGGIMEARPGLESSLYWPLSKNV